MYKTVEMGGTQVEALDSLKQKEEVCYPLNVPGVVRPHPTYPRHQRNSRKMREKKEVEGRVWRE